jgi:hypothetical protein
VLTGMVTARPAIDSKLFRKTEFLDVEFPG